MKWRLMAIRLGTGALIEVATGDLGACRVARDKLKGSPLFTRVWVANPLRSQ